MRAVWLTFGAVLTVLALFLAGGGMWAGFARARPPTHQSTRTIPFVGKKLQIEARGDVSVSIVPGAAGEIQLDQRLRWSETRPNVSEDWNGTTLRLAADCPNINNDRRLTCDTDYTVFVPSETNLDATVEAGTLRVDSLYGDVRMTTVSGDIGVTQTVGTLWARSGSGSIRAYDLRGDTADTETGEGQVELNFRERPMNVKALVRTQGDIRINVEDGAYDVTVQAETPDVDVVHDPSSVRKIDARAQYGRVDICCG
ncbi:DUF4097 family beta strand repeat-containing protein [Nonomuraea sp. NPDC050547]|uniref:DUF4097 family beta strand repeat-containing protein n=1 Tax=Nonomuraea sp. NPDC050547 TaxID=3364368 RepID=UPI0037AB8E34